MRIVITSGWIVGLAERIIEDTCLASVTIFDTKHRRVSTEKAVISSFTLGLDLHRGLS